MAVVRKSLMGTCSVLWSLHNLQLSSLTIRGNRDVRPDVTQGGKLAPNIVHCDLMSSHAVSGIGKSPQMLLDKTQHPDPYRRDCTGWNASIEIDRVARHFWSR